MMENKESEKLTFEEMIEEIDKKINEFEEKINKSEENKRGV